MMTEFVIVLPVFIMIFVGIVQLHRMQKAVNRAHIMANKAMWEQAKKVRESSPASKWGDPGQVAEVAPEPDPDGDCKAERYHECAGFDWNKYKRLVDYGTFGEALSGARFEEITEWLDIHENNTNYDEDGPVDLRMYHEIYDTSDVWGSYAVTATWDRAHSRREFEIPHGKERGALDAFNNATLSKPQTTNLVGGKKSAFAYAAGTRYGLVLGNAVETASTSVRDFDYEVEYQTLAPPRPMEKDEEAMFTVGTGRLLMTDSGFDKIPGFEYDVRLDRFEIDSLGEGD